MSKSPLFEQLEARQLLAGTVIANLVNGVLTITGDAADNSITVARDDANNRVAVFENNGAIVATTTSFGSKGVAAVQRNDGNALVFTGALTAVKVNLSQGGNDTLVLTSGADITAGGVVTATAAATTQQFGVLKTVAIQCGNGSDVVGLFGVQAGGSISVDMENSGVAGNDLLVSAGFATDAAVTGFAADTFVGATGVDFSGGAGVENFSGTAGDLNIKGEGSNTCVTLMGVHVAKNTTISLGNQTGAQAAILDVDSFTGATAAGNQLNRLARALVVKGGTGSDAVNFLDSGHLGVVGAEATQIGANVDILLGAGNDRTDGVHGDGSAGVNAGIDILGTGVVGGVAVVAGTTETASLAIGGALDITGSGGDKWIDLTDIAVRKSVELVTGNGNDAVQVVGAVSGSKIGGNLVIETGKGTDFATVAGVDATHQTTVGLALHVVMSGPGAFFGGDGVALPTAALNQRFTDVAVTKDIAITMTGGAATIFADGATITAAKLTVKGSGVGPNVAHDNATLFAFPKVSISPTTGPGAWSEIA